MIKKFDELNEEISKKTMRNALIGGVMATLGVGGAIVGNKIDNSAKVIGTHLDLPNKFDIEEKIVSIGHDFNIVKNDTLYGKIEQKMLSWGTQFIYRDNVDTIMGRAEQRIIAIGNKIDIYDENDKLIGSVEENIFESMFKVFTRYSIKDVNGNLIAESEKIDILSTDIEIKGVDGTLIATLKRPMINIARDIWSVDIKSDKIDSRLFLFMAAYKTKVDADREAEESDKKNEKLITKFKIFEGLKKEYTLDIQYSDDVPDEVVKKIWDIAKEKGCRQNSYFKYYTCGEYKPIDEVKNKENVVVDDNGYCYEKGDDIISDYFLEKGLKPGDEITIKIWW